MKLAPLYYITPHKHPPLHWIVKSALGRSKHTDELERLRDTARWQTKIRYTYLRESTRDILSRAENRRLAQGRYAYTP